MKDKQQTNMEAKTQKNETKLGKGILHKRNKEQKHTRFKLEFLGMSIHVHA